MARRELIEFLRDELAEMQASGGTVIPVSKAEAEEILLALSEIDATELTASRAQYDASGRMVAYDARGGGMYGPLIRLKEEPSVPKRHYSREAALYADEERR